MTQHHPPTLPLFPTGLPKIEIGEALPILLWQGHIVVHSGPDNTHHHEVRLVLAKNTDLATRLGTPRDIHYEVLGGNDALGNPRWSRIHPHTERELRMIHEVYHQLLLDMLVPLAEPLPAPPLNVAQDESFSQVPPNELVS